MAAPSSRFVLAVALALAPAAGCKPKASAADAGVDPGCHAPLFGSPNAATGLSSAECQPSCSCNGVQFTPPSYDDAFIQSLVDDWTLTAPYAPLTGDPYAQPVPPDDPAGTICAVVEGDSDMRPRPYSLQTFPSLAAAQAAGAHPTHWGHCGVCSTLRNLAVYMRQKDLTAPVRACGLGTVPSDGGTDVSCLQELGFDLPCAQIWAYNTTNTQNHCLKVCLQNLNASYNTPDGSLNACLQCDEDMSGPVFKAVAGRTRRNSGLPNAICRPCSEVQPLIHDY